MFEKHLFIEAFNGLIRNPRISNLQTTAARGFPNASFSPAFHRKWIGHQDNNVAECLALLEALQCALGLEAKTLHVLSDSEVMVRQMRGEYSCRSPRRYSLNWVCRKLARSLDFSISHVRRANNAEANSLASSAARNAGDGTTVGFAGRMNSKSGTRLAKRPAQNPSKTAVFD